MELSAIDDRLREALPGGTCELKYDAESQAYTVVMGIPALCIGIAIHESSLDDPEKSWDGSLNEKLEACIAELREYAMDSCGLKDYLALTAGEMLSKKIEAISDELRTELLNPPGTTTASGFQEGVRTALRILRSWQ